MEGDEVKVTLTVDEMPRKWYNILPDLPEACPPPLNPGTREPIGPDDLAPLFPMEVIRQEVSDERYIAIPDEVLEAYSRVGRPTPLYRARRLEKYLKTPAKIYYKREDVSLVGSHKANTAIAQAYYNMKQGVERLTTETGAGQWGSALSLATNMFGLSCLVFMVRVSYDQKPYRKYVMKLYGA
ncbi:MAG: pyridoxal-phosphate dependent enzyme, partial [Candidatus Micrarchaeota archaeon]